MHLCIDMQNLLLPGAPWAAPWFDTVLPRAREIARYHAAQTVFTRFIPPRSTGDAVGSWKHFFERWGELTLERVKWELLELVPALAELCPPAVVLDKPCYSAFVRTSLESSLAEKGIDTVVITGAETDICVLATVVHAIDLGFRTVLVEDAICSSTNTTHDALMTLYRTRFSTQIELASAETVLSLWNHTQH